MRKTDQRLRERLEQVESVIGPTHADGEPEARVVRFRAHARRLTWSVLVLFALAAVVPYYAGSFPERWQNWGVLIAAGFVLFLFVLMPYLMWLANSTLITTRRVIIRTGFITRQRSELPLLQVREISLRRGPLQRLWRAGDIVLQAGVGEPVVLSNVPRVKELAEVLQTLVERQYIARGGPGATSRLHHQR